LWACATLPALARDPKPFTEVVVGITADAAPEPKPSLRYRLLPELRDVQPGNPIVGYLKCFMEQERFFLDRETVAERERLAKLPLAELRTAALQDYGGAALRRADYAARLETPDWQALIPLRNEGVYMLLPDVQRMRALAAPLAVRFRGQVAVRRYEDATRTAQTMFALSRHLGEHPTLIGDLVGIAIAGVAIGPLEEMIDQSGCPNLYWALTDLPTPLVDLRKGMDGDRVMIAHEFSCLDESAPMDTRKLEQAFNQLQRLLAINPEGPGKRPGVRAWVGERVKDEAGVGAARERLVVAGLDAEQVRAFPPAQVVLLDQKHAEGAIADDVARILLLPYWQAEAYLGRQPLPRPEGTLFGGIELAALNVRRAQLRLDQRIALLRVVEALRLYAAGQGKLPGSLEEVAVPLPVDPATGRPFAYKLDGNTASIQGAATPVRTGPPFRVRYELTIRK
jgi:hypothetical protein